MHGNMLPPFFFMKMLMLMTLRGECTSVAEPPRCTHSWPEIPYWPRGRCSCMGVWLLPGAEAGGSSVALTLLKTFLNSWYSGGMSTWGWVSGHSMVINAMQTEGTWKHLAWQWVDQQVISLSFHEIWGSWLCIHGKLNTTGNRFMTVIRRIICSWCRELTLKVSDSVQWMMNPCNGTSI